MVGHGGYCFSKILRHGECISSRFLGFPTWWRHGGTWWVLFFFFFFFFFFRFYDMVNAFLQDS